MIFYSGEKVTSLINELEFNCDGWEDPELMGIQGYVLLGKKTNEDYKPMLKISKFDPSNPSVIRLGTGKISFKAEITDLWGASTTTLIAENIETLLPTNEERIAFEDSGIKEEAIVSK